MTPREIFSGNLLEQMSFAELRQVDLARRARLSPAIINKYCKGAAMPSLDTALRLAQALNVELSTLSAGLGTKKHKSEEQ